MFKVKIKRSALFVTEKEPLASGASQMYNVEFQFEDDQWSYLLKHVIFKAGNISVGTELNGNSCVIPWEVLTHELTGEPLWIGVYGSDINGKKFPTIWNILETIQPGAEPAQEGLEPTPSIIAEIKDIAEVAVITSKTALKEASVASGHAKKAKEAKEAAEAAEIATISAQQQASDSSEKAKTYMDEAKKASSEIQSTAQQVNGYMTEVRNGYANAIKKTVIGESIYANDVSPTQHDISVKLNSKNLFHFRNDYSNNLKGIDISASAGSSGFTANGTFTGDSVSSLSMSNVSITLPKGTYTLSIGNIPFNGSTSDRIHINSGNQVLAYIYLKNQTPATFTLAEETELYLVFIISPGMVWNNQNFNLQIERGTSATEIVPYADPTSAALIFNSGADSEDEYHYPDENGIVTGIRSKGTIFEMQPSIGNVIVECEYNRNLINVIDELTQAIISLGGNI